MKHALPAVALIALLSSCASLGKEASGIDRALRAAPTDFLERAVVGPAGDGSFVVPTTQVVKSAGETVQFPGRPVGLALRPDGKLIAVKSESSVLLIDMASRAVTQELKLPKGGMSFCGIEWSADGATLWTTTADRYLYSAKPGAEGKYAWDTPIDLPAPKEKEDSVPGGIALDGAFAYVTLSRNNTLGVVDLNARTLVAEIDVGIAPYDVKVLGRKAYVTNWGGRRPREGELTGPTSGSRVLITPAGIASSGTVSVLDLDARRVTSEIETGLHPSGMAFSPAHDRLYIANANSDSVTVIDTANDTVIAQWQARPMGSLPFGSAPNALATSHDGKTLYVALGGNNCIAALDMGNGHLRGLIPTDWYPGDLLIAGDTLCVANVKGIGSLNQDREDMARRLSEHLKQVIQPGNYFNSRYALGSISFVPTPGREALEKYTFQVAENMRLPMMQEAMEMPRAEPKAVPVPRTPGETSLFKHVFYIIKENRTYDQVFGDLPQGNGDPTLCHFPREVTPNQHALAEEFVLLDNLYCNGVCSADGHQWAVEGFVTDYLEKSFGDFSRSYPYDGDDALAYASSGFIWDHVLAKGFTFRDYGEMVKAEIEPRASWAEIYKDYREGTRKISIRARTEVKGLEPYICKEFVGFPGVVQDVYRADVFLKEFKEFEANGKLPNFVVMLLPNDHTAGTRPGMPTPRAAVADNDLALGRIVEAISKSQFWKDSVIFVVEDDPQAGLDHVDGHRTIAQCISPYTKRKSIDSTHYNQSSILRTIELIFGLAPMTQFTLAANPMYNCFTENADLSPFVSRPNEIPLDEMNPAVASLRGQQRRDAIVSAKLPLDEVDQADEFTFNRILWRAAKGYDTPYPKLKARPVIGGSAERDED